MKTGLGIWGAGIFITAAFAANLFATYYLGQERYVYFWDHAIFWLAYQRLGAIFDSSWTAAIQAVRDSVWFDDYNLLAVLPLMPFRSVFGDSRAAYVLGIVNVLLLPSIAMLALASVSIIKPRAGYCSRYLVAIAVLASLLSHVWWIPTLRGFPDVCGVFLIGTIMWLQFRTPLHRQRLESLFLTGFLLFLMFAMRRWYAFWVVAFFPALALAELFDIPTGRPDRWRLAVRAMCNLALTGVCAVSALFLLAKPLAIRALTVDYGDIHSAYRPASPYVDGITLARDYLGPAMIVAAAIGWGLLMNRASTRRAGAFVAIQAVLILLIFLPVQAIDVDHYFLLAPGITLGLVALAHGNAHDGQLTWGRAASGVAVIGLLSLGSFKALIPRGETLPNWLSVGLTRTESRPLVRSDISEIDRLLATLRGIAPSPEDRIYVLASSLTLNSHLLQVHCRSGGKVCALDGKIDSTHDVDKRDGFPSELLKARIVLVADPIQYHLNPQDQAVVGFPAQELLQGSGISAAFERVPQDFVLQGNVRVYLFVKKREFVAEDLASLSGKLKAIYPGHESIFRIELGEKARQVRS